MGTKCTGFTCRVVYHRPKTLSHKSPTTAPTAVVRLVPAGIRASGLKPRVTKALNCADCCSAAVCCRHALEVGLSQPSAKRKAEDLAGEDAAAKKGGTKLKGGLFDTLGNLSSDDSASEEDG